MKIKQQETFTLVLAPNELSIIRDALFASVKTGWGPTAFYLCEKKLLDAIDKVYPASTRKGAR